MAAGVAAGAACALMAWGVMWVVAVVLFCWGYHYVTDHRPVELRRRPHR